MTLSTPNVVQQIQQETKYKDNNSDDLCSTSNNSRQAQKFNIPDVLVNSPSRNTQSSKQGLLSECTVLIDSEAWRAPFTILKRALEYSEVSRFLLILQIRT